MSTTKHLILTERPGTHIEIVKAAGQPAVIVTDNYKSTMAYFEPEDGAKAALAILEAAGYDDMADDANLADVHAFNAMHKLQESVDTQERATAEAREQAELEAEALELFNTQVRALGDGLEVDSLDDMHHIAKQSWLAVARKAREMRAEK